MFSFNTAVPFQQNQVHDRELLAGTPACRTISGIWHIWTGDIKQKNPNYVLLLSFMFL